MIETLFMTVLVEGLIAVIYSISRRKPVVPILLTSVLGNILTQSLLWMVLTLSFRHYIAALSLTEVMIWGIESFLFHAVPANRLSLQEAGLLNFILNGSSLALGWILPV